MKTIYSGRLLSIDAAMLEVLKTWMQNSQVVGLALACKVMQEGISALNLAERVGFA